MELVLLYGVFLFAIIFFAVRLAIVPVVSFLRNGNETFVKKDIFGLAYLRDIGIFNNSELKEVVGIYKNAPTEKDYEHYEKYFKVLKDLKERGYYTEEVYLSKVENLKKHFKII